MYFCCVLDFLKIKKIRHPPKLFINQLSVSLCSIHTASVCGEIQSFTRLSSRVKLSLNKPSSGWVLTYQLLNIWQKAIFEGTVCGIGHISVFLSRKFLLFFLRFFPHLSSSIMALYCKIFLFWVYWMKIFWRDVTLSSTSNDSKTFLAKALKAV